MTATPNPRPWNLARLNELGFRVADSLPLSDERPMRPPLEIASRLMALDAVFSWVSASEKDASSEKLRGYVTIGALEGSMTPSELEIWNTPRPGARRAHVDQIGWRLENMWPLAWILGFEPAPDVASGMIDTPIIRAILLEFLPGLTFPPSKLLETAKLRPAAEVSAMEDYFYCAHNAVRSAQLGGKTVPEGFHPVADGGVVHERRHALTWAVSPGVDWDDTDLST